MSELFTGIFWLRSAERAVKTFAQVCVALLTASGVLGLLQVDFYQVLNVAGLSTLVSLLTSIGSAAVNGTDSPSLLQSTKEGEK